MRADAAARLARPRAESWDEPAVAVRVSEGGLPAHLGRSARRSLGAFYTPVGIADGLVRDALDLLGTGLPGLPVCLDPAVGAGVFLASLIREGLARMNGLGSRERARWLQTFACECLHGVDVDPAAVRLARTAVPAAASDLAASHRLTVDTDRIGEALSRHIIVGDSLCGGPSSNRYVLPHAAPFDLVVSNPPFVSFSGREAAPIASEERRRLREAYSTARGWPGLAPLFIELSHALLREGGVMALVLPAALVHQARYAAPRTFLHASFADTSVRALPEGAFEGVTVPTVTVVGARAAQATAPQPVTPRRDRSQSHIPLCEVATVRDVGVHTGNVRGRILADAPQGDSWVPVLRGREVTPFHVAAPGLYVDPSPTLRTGEYCRIGRPESYRVPKLLVRQTANRPIAAVDDAGTCFLNSLLALYPECDPHALCAVLNSERIAAYYRSAFPEARQRAFPQVKKGYLDAIPVPRCLLDPEHPATRELARLGRRLAAPTTGGRQQDVLRRVENLVSDLGVGEV